jgi:hypothetical protein
MNLKRGDSLLASGWRRLRILDRRSARAFFGYRRLDGDCVLAIAAPSPFAEPVALG